MSTSLNDLVAESVEAALKSEAVAEKIKVAAEKAISESITEAFNCRSEFRKNITDTIQEVLPVVNATDLACLANSVRLVIQSRLANLANETARVHIDELLERLIPDNPVITMEELREEFKDSIRESSDVCDCEDEGHEPEFLWSVVRGSGALGNYWDLVVSKDPEAGRYDRDTITFRFRDLEPGVAECWHINGNGYSKREGQKANSLFVGPLRGFDAMAFRLGTGIAKLKA